MVSSRSTASHVQDLVSQITRNDDGAHRAELIELIDSIAEPGNEAAGLAKEFLRSMGGAGCACEDTCRCGR